MVGAQFLRFLLVGGFCLALNAAIYAWCAALGWSHSAALVTAFTTSLIASYVLNRIVTFNDTGRISRSLPRVVVTYLGQLAFLWGVPLILTRAFGIPQTGAYLIALAPAVTLTFLALKYYGFRGA